MFEIASAFDIEVHCVYRLWIKIRPKIPHLLNRLRLQFFPFKNQHWVSACFWICVWKGFAHTKGGRRVPFSLPMVSGFTIHSFEKKWKVKFFARLNVISKVQIFLNPHFRAQKSPLRKIWVYKKFPPLSLNFEANLCTIYGIALTIIAPLLPNSRRFKGDFKTFIANLSPVANCTLCEMTQQTKFRHAFRQHCAK